METIVKQEFILHTNQYGMDMYFADPKIYDGVVTDDKSEALVITGEELANLAAIGILAGTGEWKFNPIAA